MNEGSPASVLFVEDDVAMADLVARVLRRDGFLPSLVHRGDEAVVAVRRREPDVVILDVMLPGCDGFSLCRALREFYRGPILMLTARGDTVDEVLGLELGADDYLVKPAEPRALVARIRALLRRRGRSDAREIRSGGLRVAIDERQVYVGECAVALTSAEYDLIEHLAVRAGEVVSRDELSMALRGIPYNGIDRSLDLRISRIRSAIRKIDPSIEPLRTIHGRGYLFKKAP